MHTKGEMTECTITPVNMQEGYCAYKAHCVTTTHLKVARLLSVHLSVG